MSGDITPVDLRGFERLTFCMPCSGVSSDDVALGLVAAPMGASAVKWPCWIDPVTWALDRRVGAGLWLWLSSLLPVCAAAQAGSSWSARSAASAGAGEDEGA